MKLMSHAPGEQGCARAMRRQTHKPLRFRRRKTLAERVSQMMHLESKAGGLNLLLASHEDEDVPFRVPQVDGNGLLHSSLHIVLLGGLAEQGLNREGAPRDLEDWHAAEEV